METFQFHAPKQLAEVYALLDEHEYDAQLIAGGTSLVTFLKQQLVQPDHLIHLGKIVALHGVKLVDNELHVGALTTYRDLETHPLVLEHLPQIAEVFGQVATLRIREVATIGGGLSQGDPAQDGPGLWLLLNARVVLSSSSGEREIAIADFFEDYYTTVIEPNEVLTELRIPVPDSSAGFSYSKFLPRSEDDYAAVSVAALVSVDASGSITAARLTLGSVSATPILISDVDQLIGQPASEQLINAVAESVRDQVDPLSDVRGSAAYKTDMAVVFTGRTLTTAANNAGS
ncbi:MAG: xanthine dehydrogenase family protein subunit M [Immundisolibacteraceae bacterium]|nr:xanthine dehydrogenase family protein subunit M [Immundisolibacteraceae bacterium]